MDAVNRGHCSSQCARMYINPPTPGPRLLQPQRHGGKEEKLLSHALMCDFEGIMGRQDVMKEARKIVSEAISSVGGHLTSSEERSRLLEDAHRTNAVPKLENIFDELVENGELPDNLSKETEVNCQFTPRQRDGACQHVACGSLVASRRSTDRRLKRPRRKRPAA